MTIPRLSGRLECMQYRRKLDLDIEEIRPDLNILRNVSRELRGSVKFKQTLQVWCPRLSGRVLFDDVTGCIGARQHSQWFNLPRRRSRFPT